MRFIQKLVVNITLYYDDASFKKFLHSQDRAESYPNTGLVTSTLLLAQTKNTVLIRSSFGCTPIFKRMSAIFFVRVCDCSQSSTSVVLCVGSICSHELANVQILFAFSALRVALTIGEHHFARFHNYHDPRGFCKGGCGLCIRIIEVLDNQGSDNQRCTARLFLLNSMPIHQFTLYRTLL